MTSGRTLKAGDNPELVREMGQRLRTQHAPVLLVVSGQHTGQRCVLQESCTVGRDPHAQLVITDALVSFHHLRLEDRGDGWAAVDLGSTNGSEVNGEPIPREGRVLTHGDTLSLGGGAHVRFELQDPHQQVYSEALETLLNTDDLSGLLVRRAFDSELQRLVASSSRESKPVSLLVMDLDGLKAINDTHGHLYGAHTIGEAGKVIGRYVEGRGVACRFGGDEYLAALWDHNLSRALQFSERLRQAIEQHPFEYQGQRLHPTISIGVASCPAQAKAAAELFDAADQAMYRAKRAGKNRISA